MFEFRRALYSLEPEDRQFGPNRRNEANKEIVCGIVLAHYLFETQQFDFKDKLAVGHDPPCRESPASIGVIGRAGEFGDFALRHGKDALIPSLDDLSHPHGKGKSGLSRILCS